MNMKDHILAALGEQLEAWETLLAGMDEAQMAIPHLPSEWSTQDEVAHLRAWQQRSIARVDAARSGREPVYPAWPAGLDPNSDDSTEQINAWIFASNRGRPWTQVHREWREGFLHFLEAGAAVPERDLLDPSRYAWLDGIPLASILLASYDHHQEHLEKTTAWLQAHGMGKDRR
ncbi:MAG TPA: ClbS/DfsB family four-helix bundle protein [Anaerolineales bacterium]|nr:ClbS/DfsB family four-helix bundle protein [Anaerolineales bacterium]